MASLRRPASLLAGDLLRRSFGSHAPSPFPSSSSVVGAHTAKWMQDASKKSPMELINEVPPIKVGHRIVACEGGDFCFLENVYDEFQTMNELELVMGKEITESVNSGDSNPALGHPIEFICLDKEEPAICKYCGLRYVQDHHH